MRTLTCFVMFFFLMIRRPPRSTQGVSSAASDVYKRQLLYGACESFYKEGMGPEELFEVISQALLSCVHRDILSGWGAYVYILTPTELITNCLLYTSPSPRDLSTSRMPSSA
eukprot:TRINITY_DN15483_c0_g1_i3.p2 TRINITY_DN15483_c0_g1~~TRINITY_DN15483_c0_g1_i3.p2  ORF type:complete len:112 (+),score=27.03 TRINITY_DN15483_c0_g1_i3:72-407(+)